MIPEILTSFFIGIIVAILWFDKFIARRLKKQMGQEKHTITMSKSPYTPDEILREALVQKIGSYIASKNLIEHKADETLKAEYFTFYIKKNDKKQNGSNDTV